MQLTRWGLDRPSSDVMSSILNCVCPECGGSMGAMGKEFKCQGKCQTDWRHIWEPLAAGLSRQTANSTKAT
jgi:tRNA(Ile2) C34 agmatinyltransferase TiaS